MKLANQGIKVWSLGIGRIKAISWREKLSFSGIKKHGSIPKKSRTLFWGFLGHLINTTHS